MKSNRLTNILLVAVLAVLLSGRLPAAAPTPVQPAAAAPATLGVSSMMPNAVSGYVSVPAAAFHPRNSWATYENVGESLWSNSMTGTNRYVAEVYLPHGSTIDSLECFMADQMVSYEGSCDLEILQGSDGTYHPMGTVSTSGYLGYYTDFWTTTISFADVDNNQNAYFLDLYLPGNGGMDVIFFFFARIHYYYNAIYLPSVSK